MESLLSRKLNTSSNDHLARSKSRPLGGFFVVGVVVMFKKTEVIRVWDLGLIKINKACFLIYMCYYIYIKVT